MGINSLGEKIQAFFSNARARFDPQYKRELGEKTAKALGDSFGAMLGMPKTDLKGSHINYSQTPPRNIFTNNQNAFLISQFEDFHD